MFRFFESRVPAYPPAEPHLPPRDFMACVWDGTRGLRGYVVAMAGLSAAIAVYEAALFAVLGHVVDWLSTTAPSALWAEHRAALIGVTALLLGSVVLVAVPYFTTGALFGRLSDHPLYAELAQELNIPLLAGVWAEILGDPKLKSDQIHANAQGYRVFAEKMQAFLRQQGFAA